VRKRRSRLIALLALPLGLAACHQYLDPRLYGPLRGDLPDPPAGDVLQVRFLGVQGFVIRVGDVAVMTPPLYSNPSLGRVLAGNRDLPHRPDLVDRALRGQGWLKDVSAILVGHSHYDHLMDVPHVWREYARDATIYGSRTARFLLESMEVDASHVVDLTAVPQADGSRKDCVDYRPCRVKPREGCIHEAGEAGDWVTPPGAGGRLRFRALCSRHSPQFARAPVSSQGCYWGPLSAKPRTADDWRLGDTYAYLVEFMDGGGAVSFRVYFQDSGTAPTFGYLPRELCAYQNVDVALLCAGGFDQVPDNPAGILRNTDPRYVIWGHWENFFQPFDRPLRTLFTIDLDRLGRLVEQTGRVPPSLGREGQYWFAAPGTLYLFARGGTRTCTP
jgi:L-ascorbate metabolism protein UlaG (beta-lactamase superfamily)